MSWLSGLAGKAEALLNQVDQAAAQSLQDVGVSSSKPSQQSSYETTPITSDLTYEPVAQPTKPSPRTSSGNNRLATPTGSTWDNSLSWSPSDQKSRSFNEDNSFIEFLNSSSTTDKKYVHKVTTPTSKNVTPAKAKKVKKSKVNIKSTNTDKGDID